MSTRRISVISLFVLLLLASLNMVQAQQTPQHIVDAAVAAANNEIPGLGRPNSWQHTVLPATNSSTLGCEIAVGTTMDVTVLPYRVVLQYPNASYVVHVSDDGSRVQVCDLQFPSQGAGVSGGGQAPPVSTGDDSDTVQNPTPADLIAAFPCPADFAGYMIPRIQIGTATAQVSQGGIPNRLRAEPNVGAAIVAQAQPGRHFDQVLAGPACSDTFVWWLVSIDGNVGWTAESDAGSQAYFLEPLPGFEAVPPPAAANNVIVGGAVITNNNLLNLQRGQSHAAQFARDLAWSPDGTRIAFLGDDGSGDGLIILRAPTLTPDPMQNVVNNAIAPNDLTPISAFAFSPDGNSLAIGGADGSLHLINLASGQITTLINRHELTVLALNFSPDGRMLASVDGFFECHEGGCGGAESTLLLTDISSLNLATGQTPLLANLRFPDTIFEVEFSADGQYFAVAGFTALWSYNTNTRELVFLRAVNTMNGFPFLTPVPSAWPDAAPTFVYADGGDASFFNPMTQVVNTFMGEPSGNISDIIFNPVPAPGTNVVLYARLLQSDIAPTTLTFFSPQDFGPLLQLPTIGVRDAAFSPDGRALAVLTDSGLEVWSVPA